VFLLLQEFEWEKARRPFRKENTTTDHGGDNTVDLVPSQIQATTMLMSALGEISALFEKEERDRDTLLKAI
jgi:hypothetical protein